MNSISPKRTRRRVRKAKDQAQIVQSMLALDAENDIVTSVFSPLTSPENPKTYRDGYTIRPAPRARKPLRHGASKGGGRYNGYVLLPLLPQVLWSPEARPAGGAKGALVLRDGRVLVARSEGARIVLSQSGDEGKTWRDVSTVATGEEGTDMGDGNLVQTKDALLYVYRFNRKPSYSIRVAQSRDGGRTWTDHSTVEAVEEKGPGPSRGLWAPFLFVTRKGRLQCYYDDEHTPFVRGFPGHQWVTMREWDGKRWGEGTTVARAHDPALLSRDGMATVVETAPDKLLCAFESVQTERPLAGVARLVTSEDGGQHWSWEKRERAVLYEPKDRRFLVFCPWLAQVGKSIVCVFATSEDMPEPGVSGTPAHQLRLDVKSVVSDDGGKTWGAKATVYKGTDRNYLSGVVALPKGRLLCTFLDFDKGFMSVEGRLEK